MEKFYGARAALEGDIKLMEDYLNMKVRQRDWHGVADASMDLREMEAKLKMLPEEEKPT